MMAQEAMFCATRGAPRLSHISVRSIVACLFFALEVHCYLRVFALQGLFKDSLRLMVWGCAGGQEEHGYDAAQGTWLDLSLGQLVDTPRDLMNLISQQQTAWIEVVAPHVSHMCLYHYPSS